MVGGLLAAGNAALAVPLFALGRLLAVQALGAFDRALPVGAIALVYPGELPRSVSALDADGLSREVADDIVPAEGLVVELVEIVVCPDGVLGRHGRSESEGSDGEAHCGIKKDEEEKMIVVQVN